VALYGLFVFVQTVRHRDYFVVDIEHAVPPSDREALLSLALLVAGLIAVVGLAKVESKAIEDAVTAVGAPKSAVGVVIALLVLAPETLAAVRNAARDRVQTSLNLALGSALACIGLTIPAVAAVSLVLHVPLALGLDGKEEVLLALTLLVGVVTLGTGRTTLMQGAVHLVIVASYLFLSFVP
jgi:Ca2+:H+ antiporter